jgi:phosphoribosylanthranilate isomerase
VQWHGDQPELPQPGLRFIPAFPVRDQDSLTRIHTYLGQCRTLGSLPVAVLVDAQVAGKHGGTGQAAPWDLLATFRAEVPLILAGGLTPDNVAEAIRLVQPYAVDVASGVESTPGRKDSDKMRQFIDVVRSL